MALLRYYLLLSLMILPAVAFSWGRSNHFVTGKIAMDFLTPEASEKIGEILGEQNIAEIASWADEVRNNRRNTSPFHYINIDPTLTELTPSDLEQEKGNVYMAVVGYASILTNPESTGLEKEEALKYLVHFIGDLHQPLHCGYAVDLGGNRIEGFYFEDATNLHRMWDSGIIDQEYGKLTPDLVAEQIMNSMSDEDIEQLKNDTDINSWILESKELLLEDFYPPGMKPGAMPTEESFKLGAEYQERHLATAKKRVAQAGIRMAATLNMLLAEEPLFPFEPLTIKLPIEASGKIEVMPPLFKSGEDTIPSIQKPAEEVISKTEKTVDETMPASAPVQ